MKSDPTIVLHVSIISPVDLGRIQRELYSIDSHFQARDISVDNRVHTTAELDNLIKSSGVDLAEEQQRHTLIQQLQFVRRTAPTVRIVFSKQPGNRELSMLVKWFREFGHPNTLIEAGVDPSIGGGCIVKTSTKKFDFSYARLLSEKHLTLSV